MLKEDYDVYFFLHNPRGNHKLCSRNNCNIRPNRILVVRNCNYRMNLKQKLFSIGYFRVIITFKTRQMNINSKNDYVSFLQSKDVVM